MMSLPGVGVAEGSFYLLRVIHRKEMGSQIKGGFTPLSWEILSGRLERKPKRPNFCSLSKDRRKVGGSP